MANIRVAIPNAKYAEFKAAVLRARPIPVTRGPNGTSPTPSATDDEHLHNLCVEYLTDLFRQGKRLLAADALVVDADLVTPNPI